MERSKEEIHAFLSKISEDLQEFVTKAIKEEDGLGSEWSHLFDGGQNPKCYQMMGCSKTYCPMHGSNDYRCWLQPGTFCGRKPLGDFAEKFSNCLQCEVYQFYHREPIRSLYENIDILISHLTGEVGEYRLRSFTDRLTGVFNRNFFEELIRREVDKAVRMGFPCSFMMIDLNDFKEINDAHGHLTGDFYLKEAAKLLQSCVRYSDVVFRIGGDEFLILLTNADEQGCDGCYQRICQEVEQWNAKYASEHGAELSLSIGMATLQPGEREFEEAIRRADAEMYRQKAAKKADR